MSRCGWYLSSQHHSWLAFQVGLDWLLVEDVVVVAVLGEVSSLEVIEAGETNVSCLFLSPLTLRVVVSSAV